MKELIGTLLRALLKVGGGALVAKGLLDEGAAQELIGAGMTLFGVLWGIASAYRAAKSKPAPDPARRLVMLAWFGLAITGLAAGCARFTTTQTDLSYDDQGKPARQITTKATAGTLFAARSALTAFKASQTDKTQSATVGRLDQQSQDATNTLAGAGAFLGELIRAAGRP